MMRYEAKVGRHVEWIFKSKEGKVGKSSSCQKRWT